jgi:hypothetical protein
MEKHFNGDQVSDPSNKSRNKGNKVNEHAEIVSLFHCSIAYPLNPLNEQLAEKRVFIGNICLEIRCKESKKKKAEKDFKKTIWIVWVK